MRIRNAASRGQVLLGVSPSAIEQIFRRRSRNVLRHEGSGHHRTRYVILGKLSDKYQIRE